MRESELVPSPTRSVLRNDTTGNVAVLISGNLIGQALTVGAAPLLSRLYTSAELGTYGIFVGLLGILAICASGQLWMAINVARDESEADALLGAGMLMACCCGLLTTAAVPFLQRAFPALTSCGWLLPGATLLSGMQLLLTGWLSRKKSFSRVACSYVLRAGSLVTVQAGVALVLPSSLGLVAAQLLALAVVCAFLAEGVARKITPPWPSFRAIYSAWCHHSGFIKFNVPRALVHAVGQNGGLFIFADAFGSTAGGEYWMAFRIVGLPSIVIGEAVKQVVWQRIGATSGPERFRTIAVTMSLLTGLVVIPLVVVWFYGPMLFGALLGAAWQQAGVYAGWLALAQASDLIATPVEAGLSVSGRQHLHLVIETGATIAKVGAIWLVAASSGDDIEALIGLTVSTVLANLLAVAVGLRSVRAARGNGEAKQRGGRLIPLETEPIASRGEPPRTASG